LTQRSWAEHEKDAVDGLPEPFATIALRCLVPEPTERCHLPELVALVRGEIKPAPRPKPVPAQAPTVVAATVLPIDEPQNHAAGMNGTPTNTPASDGKVETIGKRTEEPRAQAASAAASASTPAVAANGTAKPESPVVQKTGPGDSVESRTPIQRPTPVVNKPPVSKVKPISEGPAPAPFPAKPTREDVAFRREDTHADDRSSKIWIWAGVALVAVLLVIWALRPKHSAPVASGPSAPSAGASRAAQTRAGGNAWETKTIQPDGTATTAAAPGQAKAPSSAVAPAPAPPKATPKSRAQTAARPAINDSAKNAESTPTSGDVWRTVLYTYNREADAEEKAKALNAQHANLHAEVFAPSGDAGPYVVAAGGRMSREEAVQMRKRVISLGLPHDAYIQNFKH